MQNASHHGSPLLLSPEHPCPYLAGKTARTVFLDPRAAFQTSAYAELLAQGFRRNGAYLYRPECPGCRACVPLRIPVHDFAPDRSQRRTWKRNQDLDVHVGAADFKPEHFDLYRCYLAWKHPGGGMDESSPADYANFLMTPNGRTQLAEFRLHGQLMAIAVMDIPDNGLSAIYTFYTPEWPQRSLGTFAILWEITEAKRRGLQWLYIGYWVAASPKMAYKNHFLPHELLTENGWRRITHVTT